MVFLDPKVASGTPGLPLKLRFSGVGAGSLRGRPPGGFVDASCPVGLRGCGYRSRAARLPVPERRRRSSWTWTSSPQSVGGPRAGETGGRSSGSPRWVRIFRIAPGSVMNAISRMSPPQSGHSRAIDVGDGGGWACLCGMGCVAASAGTVLTLSSQRDSNVREAGFRAGLLPAVFSGLSSFLPRIHARPILRHTSTGSPLPQALDLFARRDSHRYDETAAVVMGRPVAVWA